MFFVYISHFIEINSLENSPNVPKTYHPKMKQYQYCKIKVFWKKSNFKIEIFLFLATAKWEKKF